jgi:hypothetical protein
MFLRYTKQVDKLVENLNNNSKTTHSTQTCCSLIMLLRIFDWGVIFSTDKPQDSKTWQLEPNVAVRDAREGGPG